LKTNEKILGVINVSNKLSGEMFTAGDEKLLLTLASQASIAIDNARLVAELKENNSSPFAHSISHSLNFQLPVECST
jgi:GAF domain-containing protein